MTHHPKVIMPDNAPFPKLRAAYLRAIAAVWIEEVQSRDDDPGSLKSRLLRACNTQADEKPHVSDGVLTTFAQWAYPDEQASTPQDQFDFPFRVQLLFDTTSGYSDFVNRPRWVDDNGDKPDWTKKTWIWDGESGDKILIYLPQAPVLPPGSDLDLEYEYAYTLAQYGAHFPSILGAPGTFYNADPDSQKHYKHINAPVVFVNVQLYIVQALARAWNDPKFRAGLFAQGDIRTWFEKQMATDIPWLFEMSFCECPERTPLSNDNPELIKEYWNNFPYTRFTLGFPAVAQSDKSNPAEAAVALAAYNSTGGEYPYTCI